MDKSETVDKIIYLCKTELYKMKDVSHESIRHFIVFPVLRLLGYDVDDSSKVHQEQPSKYDKDTFDMSIDCNEKEKFFVEIKKGDVKLTPSCVAQIIKYIHSNSGEWGILTNGSRFILVNDDISGNDIMDKVVLDIMLEKKKNIHLLIYFSMNNIFITKKSLYFKSVAQFKAYSEIKESSWKNYRSTLYNFFEYLCEKNKTYINLEVITFDMFEDYIEVKKVTNKRTYNNNKSHLLSMFECLYNNNYIRNNMFKQTLCNKHVNSCKLENIKKDFLFNDEIVNRAVAYLQSTRNSVRNILLLLMVIYTGRTRHEIIDLKWDDVNMKKKKILFPNNSVDMPLGIYNLLIQLETKFKNKKNKPVYIFTPEDNPDTKMRNATLTDVYADMKSKINWENCTAERIAKELVSLLFKCGYPIEEISSLTGRSLSNIERIIPFKQMIEMMGKRKSRKHPFADILGIE